MSPQEQPLILAPEDEAAIHSLLQKIGDCWSRGDGNAFAEPFADDADYIVATGDFLKGRRQIADVHQRVFDGIFKGTRLGGRLTSLRCITPDVVLVHSVGGILFAGEADGSVEANGLTTLVVAKQGGVWRIVCFQNTPTGRHRKLRFFWRLLKSKLRLRR